MMPAGCLEEGGEGGREEEEEERRLREVLKDCSVVCGMHPDQATDNIFEAALAFGKPVACVPCCVFAREFPHRRRPKRVVVEGERGRDLE